MATQCGIAGRVHLSQEPKCLVGTGNRVQFGQYFDRRVLQLALLVGGSVSKPVSAERVGHYVGWDNSLDEIHQEERTAEYLAGRLDPAHARHGHVGQLAHHPDHVVLVIHSIVDEHRHILSGRRHPRHPFLLDPLAVLLPASGQDDGL